MISRSIENNLRENLGNDKAIIILGARQTGKSTLLEKIFSTEKNVLWLNGDEPQTHALFEKANASYLNAYLKGYRYLVVDEAQRIENVGIKFKLITDSVKSVQLIASGSSAFELANKINEPLTGRKWEYHLFPFSYGEMAQFHGLAEEEKMLKHRLVFGYYPDVVNHPDNAKDILKQLTDSYLYKDILMWENIKKPEKLLKLLQALAFQVGSEVSYHELGQMVDLDNQTVEKYIQLLEKSFVIFRLGAFNRNLRKELKKSKKIYFYDNGIRNALIANFSLPEIRNDIGALWENFVLSERMKYVSYNSVWANQYFWRTQDQQEIDYIEERDGILHAFEFKWRDKDKKVKLSKTFAQAYPEHQFKIITPDNLKEFLIDPL